MTTSTTTTTTVVVVVVCATCNASTTTAIVHANPERMEFRGGRKGDGWCLNAVDDNGDEEPWTIACALEEIKEYEQPAELNVFKVYIPH
jgi:hypothetical protein